MADIDALPRLFTLEEVAERTRICLRNLQDGCRGQNPKYAHVRPGKQPLMTAEQVQGLIDATTRASGDGTDSLAKTRERVLRQQARQPKQRKPAA